jgi:hypothetical protein
LSLNWVQFPTFLTHTPTHTYTHTHTKQKKTHTCTHPHPCIHTHKFLCSLSAFSKKETFDFICPNSWVGLFQGVIFPKHFVYTCSQPPCRLCLLYTPPNPQTLTAQLFLPLVGPLQFHVPKFLGGTFSRGNFPKTLCVYLLAASLPSLPSVYPSQPPNPDCTIVFTLGRTFGISCAQILGWDFLNM